MRTLAILLLTALLAVPALAEPVSRPGLTPADKARSKIGQEARIVGKVVDVHMGKNAVHLFFGDSYPHEVFTVVIPKAEWNKFSHLEKLAGKEVEVSGKVTEYLRKPEMILHSKDQLKVLK